MSWYPPELSREQSATKNVYFNNIYNQIIHYLLYIHVCSICVFFCRNRRRGLVEPITGTYWEHTEREEAKNGIVV